MEKLLKRLNGSPFVKLMYLPHGHYIFMDWDGYLDVELVMQGSEALLEMIQQFKVEKVLISNEKVTGPWSKANDWYANDWNPRAKDYGLKYMAVVVSDNIFAQLSLHGFEKVNNGNYIVYSHYDVKVAKTWLEKQA